MKCAQSETTVVSSRIAVLALLAVGVASGQHYQQTNLVSNRIGVAANTDTHLVNAWGLARSSTSPLVRRETGVCTPLISMAGRSMCSTPVSTCCRRSRWMREQDAAKHDDIPGPGNGALAVFTPEGRLIRIFEHTDDLNSPWGLALAPGDFGSFSHHLLVGQFGSGAANSGPATTLFFTAGPDEEQNGLFGTLTAVTTDLIQGNGN